MKKILTALLIAAALATVLLSACAGNGGTSSLPPAEQQSSATAPETSDPGTEDSSLPSGENSPDETQPQTESEPEAVSKDEPSADSSVPPAESSAPAVSEPETSDPGDEPAVLDVLFCSYSEKPYFAIIGRCEEGAVVYGESDVHNYSSQSWHGWYSLRMKCTGSSVNVKIHQQVDGKDVGETLLYIARPTTPSSDMEGVVTGRDCQFFYQKNLPDYLKNNIPSQSTFDTLTTHVKNRVEAIHRYNPNAEIIYLIVPASITIYPEVVPEIYVQPSGPSRMDKTIEAVRAGGATAIDLRPALTEHKNDEMSLYYHFDTHWADYGGYIAYVELFNHIAERFPAAAPRPVEDFDWNPDWYESGDMTYYLGIPQEKVMDYGYYRKFNVTVPSDIASVPRYRRETSLVYSDAVTRERYFTTNRSELPSCVVYRDSFGTQMYDIIAERMNKTHYMGMWGYAWNNNVIQSEKPDYIIYIIAEWNLNSIIYN